MFRGIVFFVLTFLFGLAAQAQSLTKGFEEFDKKNYGTAREIFNKYRDKTPAGAFYGLSLLFFKEERIDSAYLFIQKADAAYEKLDAKERKALDEIKVNSLAIKTQRWAIHEYEYKKAEAQNTILAYDRFVRAYPDAQQKDEALRKIETLAFEQAQKTNTSAAYYQFLNQYPKSGYGETAQKRYEEQLYAETVAPHTPAAFADYIQKQPKGRFVAEAQDSLYILSTQNNTETELAAFLKKYPKNPNIPKVWDRLLALYDEPASAAGLQGFLAKYPQNPLKTRVSDKIQRYQQTLLPVKIQEKWGYCNPDGQMVLDTTFFFADRFSENLAAAEDANGKLGFIDKTGAWRIKPQFDEADPFKNGSSVVAIKDKFGVVKRSGKIILPIQYESVTLCENGLLLIEKNGKLGYAEPNGNLITEIQFEEAHDFKEGRALVKINGQYGFIDENGHYAITPLYPWAEDFENGQARVSLNDSVGLINPQGQTIIAPRYEALGRFSDGLAFAVKNGKLGYINAQDTTVIPFQYDYLPAYEKDATFSGGLAKVYQKGRVGLINKQGALVIPIKFEDLQRPSEKLTALRVNGKWGFADSALTLKIKYQYDLVFPFRNQRALVMKKGLFGLIDPNEKVILPPHFQSIQYLNDTLLWVKKDDLFGLFVLAANEAQEVLPIEWKEIYEAEKGVLGLKKGEQTAYYSLVFKKYIWKPENF